MKFDEKEIFDEVIGGVDLSPEDTRVDICSPDGLIASSSLDRKIVRLLTLHPNLKMKFRNNTLAGLDESTKQALLEDMQTALGITKLRNE